MEIKNCPKCKQELLVTEFSKSRFTKDGYEASCKKCRNEYAKNNYKKRKEGGTLELTSRYCKEYSLIFLSKKNQRRKEDFIFFIEVMYKTIQNRVKFKSEKEKYRGVFLCEKDEFLEIAVKDENLKDLYKKWQDCGFVYKQTPSVDRIDNDMGYVIGNIQFLTVSENSFKRNRDTILKRENSIKELNEKILELQNEINEIRQFLLI